MEKNSNKGLQIELLGMPASGKTTIVNRVVGSLNQRGIPTNNSPYSIPRKKFPLYNFLARWVPVLGYCLCRPVPWLRAARIVLSRQERNETYTPRLMNSWSFLAYHLYRTRRLNKVTFFCQSYLQWLWSIGFSSTEGYLYRLPDSFLNSLPIADLVVILETDLVILEQRYKSRPAHSRLEERILEDPYIIQKGLGVFSDVKNILIRIIRERDDIQILRIYNNNTEDLERNVRNIVDQVDQLWNNSVRLS